MGSPLVFIPQGCSNLVKLLSSWACWNEHNFINCNIHSPRFWHSIGFNLKDPAVVRRILPKSHWYTGQCSPGVYGCASIEFLDDNNFIFHPVGPGCENTTKECEKIKKNNEGTYTVSKDTVILRYNSGTVTIYIFPGPDGTMKQINGSSRLQDSHPDPCSA